MDEKKKSICYLTFRWPLNDLDVRFTVKDRSSWGIFLHFWRIYGLKSQKLKRTSFGFLFLEYFQKNIFHFRPKMKKNVQAISVSYFQLFIRVLHFMRTTRNHIGNTNRLGSFRRYVLKKVHHKSLIFKKVRAISDLTLVKLPCPLLAAILDSWIQNEAQY